MRAALAGVLAVAACDDATDRDPGPTGLADVVLDAPGASDAPFGDPERAVNGVRGGGVSRGGTDVYSLGLDGPEATLTLGWDGAVVVDRDGVDLVVYENPFVHPGGVFFDPVVVEVSADGSSWVAFPFAHAAPDPTAWSADPAHWPGFAGRTPVTFHEDGPPTDPLDPAASGGDGFDLADLAGLPGGEEVLADGVCCVRLSSATAWIDPATGAPYPKDPVGNGADIDGVYGFVAP